MAKVTLDTEVLEKVAAYTEETFDKWKNQNQNTGPSIGFTAQPQTGGDVVLTSNVVVGFYQVIEMGTLIRVHQDRMDKIRELMTHADEETVASVSGEVAELQILIESQISQFEEMVSVLSTTVAKAAEFIAEDIFHIVNNNLEVMKYSIVR